MTQLKKSKLSVYEGWNVMPDQPRECCYCGKPVTLKQNVGFRTMEPKASWHMACLPLLPWHRIAHD